MRSRALRSIGLVALVLVACTHSDRPPSVSPSAKLSPRVEEDGPRTEAAFAVVFSGPHGEHAANEKTLVTVLFTHRKGHFGKAAETEHHSATPQQGH